MTNSVWNIVVIMLVTLAALGVISFISLVDTGVAGGAVSCGVGMASGWLVGFLLIALIAGAGIMFFHRRPQH
jgi:hypothetical protein